MILVCTDSDHRDTDVAQTQFKHRTDDNLFIRIFTAVNRTIGRSWNSADVCDSVWRLYINGCDGAAIDWAGGRFPIRRGRVHLIPAWLTFTCQCTRNVGHFYIHFDLAGLPGTVVREVFDRPMRLQDGSAAQQLMARLAADVAGQRVGGIGLTFRAKAAVSEVMAEALADLSPAAATRCQALVAGQFDVGPALRWIEENLSGPISNGELAALCHLSESHFIRRFREVVHQSPMQYVMERRISGAAQMLLSTDESIERIAEASGFANRFHFSAAFGRVMGVGPGGYRRAGRV